ncbi:hypothetical protein [Longispora albida]|uniref:hypothetical protein n=1 Tax=Longispora albida TaxID=203523 RepID=UPI00037C2324|nr:hypothetical protein [Longispora albida]
MIGGVGGWVLDVAALLEFADATTYAEAVTRAARRHSLTMLVPIGVLAEAYAARPLARHRKRLEPIRDERDMWLLTLPGDVPADELARYTALASGDQTAAHVAVTALRRGWPVVTDRDQLFHRIAPGLQIIPA